MTGGTDVAALVGTLRASLGGFQVGVIVILGRPLLSNSLVGTELFVALENPNIFMTLDCNADTAIELGSSDELGLYGLQVFRIAGSFGECRLHSCS